MLRQIYLFVINLFSSENLKRKNVKTINYTIKKSIYRILLYQNFI